MNLSAPSEFSTFRLAYAARLKGLPKEALMGWMTPAERAIVEEAYASSIYPNADLYLKAYGLEY